MQSAQERFDHLRGCGWFWAWALVGCGAALGMISFAIGPLLWLPTLGVGLALASSPRVRRSAFGLLTGAGSVSLLVAWVQRRGPGTVCWHKAMSSGCDSYLDPRPWLVIGLVLVLAGVVGQVLRRA